MTENYSHGSLVNGTVLNIEMNTKRYNQNHMYHLYSCVLNIVIWILLILGNLILNQIHDQT